MPDHSALITQHSALLALCSWCLPKLITLFEQKHGYFYPTSALCAAAWSLGIRMRIVTDVFASTAE
jgi:hypothetical protein